MNRTGTISADVLRRAMLAAGDHVAASREELSALDAAAGDGDLGVTLATGFGQVRLVLEQADGSDVGVLLSQTGRTLMRKAPSTFGSLLGLAFVRAGSAFAGTAQLSADDVVRLLGVLTQAVSERGGAVPGQRTVVDALDGAAAAATGTAKAGSGAAEVLASAAQGAADAADRTAEMEPAVGRAAWLADRARGSRDAGAVAWATYLGALAASVAAARATDA
jgi:phosphoenolpyruvate---glycerone phosphotransferase subunit DhaL